MVAKQEMPIDLVVYGDDSSVESGMVDNVACMGGDIRCGE